MKKIYIFIVIAIILNMIIIFSKNTSTNTANSKQIDSSIIINKNINLRVGPGLSYPITDIIIEGQALTKVDQQGEWIKVAIGEDEGWIPSWQTTTDEQLHTTNRKVATSNVDGLNIRAQPTTSSAVLKQLSIGDEVIVEKEEDDWVKIDDSTGISGWISKDFITLSDRSNEEIPVSTNSDLAQEQTYFTIKIDSVIVRKEPNLSSAEVGLVYLNDTFEVLEQKTNWVKIQLAEDQVGWIYRFYGTFDSSISSNSDLETVTIIYGETNLREGPTTSSPVVKRASIGDTFEILSTEGEWFKVAINENETAFVANWVVSSNLKKQSNSLEEPKIVRKKGTLNGVTIVLDPGHGGNDQGTAGFSGTIEKDLTLMTAQLLQDKLQNAGATVYLTRDSDLYVDLRQRVSFAHYSTADAFISIHYDATDDASISGFTTYYYHDYQQELAQFVNEGITKKVTLRDRGAQLGDYLVLRENYQNAILIELGYLSNPVEERIITTDFYREQATLGIYNGIIDYFDAQIQ